VKSSVAPRPYRQVARAAAQQRTRDSLLDEAERAFFAGEYDEISLDSLADRAGTTKQTLLRHFSSKRGLFDAAAARGRERVTEQRMAAPVGDVAGAVDNLLDHYEQRGEEALRMLAFEDRSAMVADQVQFGREFHYEWVRAVFAPWLDRLPRAARERRHAALVAICDVYTWKILARDLRLGRRKVRATLIESIERLLEEGP
jgi:AcrR family transcriptional regulator